MASGSKTSESQRKAAFTAMADQMLRAAGQVVPTSQPVFGILPSNLQGDLLSLHAAMLGEGLAASEALRSLDPVWAELVRRMHARIDGEKASQRAGVESEIDRVRDQIDLVELLGGRGGRFAARLLEWLKAQPADPDLWHDIATMADPDGMDDVFEWIVLQPRCDAATAAFIFHAINAFEQLSFRDETAAGMYASRFRAAIAISRRWKERSFPTARFSFTSEGYEETLESYRDYAAQAAARFGAAPFEPHEGLFRFQQGQPTASRHFFNGQMTKLQYMQLLDRRRNAAS
jgi:hypothetical protein